MSDPNEPTTALPLGGVGPGTPSGSGRPGPGEPTVDLGRTVDLGGTVGLGAQPPAGGTVAGGWAWPGEPGATWGGGGSARTAGGFTGPTIAAGGTAPAPVAGPTVGGSVGEVRFGPGVPAAPAWQQSGSARRPRSPWRRVVSVLSTLVTVVLVVAVGLFVWQRLSPLVIEGVTVAVTEPAGDRCDVTVEVVATVRTNGNAGTIRYQWLRSGSTPGALVGERVGRGQRTVALPLKWSFSGVGATRETATVNIVEPSTVQAGTEVSYVCRRR
ncbi:hypothetical protein ACH4OY_25140 [Micromonospora rubida]|uniref:Ig-like domain-containing protein n=1 Tax=Micromonospora rubida TaxID=2697657 RepID=A0ABW7SSN6_9ACTN